MPSKFTCPNCGSSGMEVFYSVDRAPIHSVLLLDSREEALNYPSGSIHLGLCDHCGFISNVAFDGHLQEYAGRYEATQSYSPTFTAFARSTALDLIARHDLHGKSIIEIGCGQGEFLLELCELGGNRGIGFDPAYRGEPIDSEARDRVQFIADAYSEKYRAYRGDFICCKMTLEHIWDTFDFMHNVRQSVADNPNCVVFFQVPNGEYVLRDTAFWDVYYEHCSYFTAASLTYLFERSGFAVERTYTVYDDQYLVVEARPAAPVENPLLTPEAQAGTRALVDQFVHNVELLRDQWKANIEQMVSEGKEVVLWGGGSKGVAFLTTLGLHHQIKYVVDINPKKMGKFMATTGQEIVQPDFLKTLQPDTVIVMNPVYCREIGAMLEEMNVTTSMLSL